MLDAAILLLFAASIALCKPGRREQARDSLAAFAVSSAVAGYTIALPWPWLNYCFMWVICAVWLVALAKRGAEAPATAVGGLLILMVAMSVDRLLFADRATPLYNSYEYVAGALYVFAIIGTIWHGRGGNGNTWMPRRRRTDYLHNPAREVADK